MTGTDEDQLHAAALAALPGCGPARLRALVHTSDPLADVWREVAAGRALSRPGVEAAVGGRAQAARLATSWADVARRVDLARLRARLEHERAVVAVLGRDGYPAALADDPDPPAVLFVAGMRADALDRSPKVALVGTRRCTHYGADVARQLGRDLTAAGVVVVSGLALGIDGAAHEGALASDAAGPHDEASVPPVAVVGSGLDVIYPRRHRRLWHRVLAAGAVVTEAPLGAPADPWRFPLRNRIIAGLADVVVVVESHAAGGSMHTVQAAADRGVPVMAVPGSVRSPSSAGTNRLLAEGVAPVLDADDVLVALSLVARPTADGAQRAPSAEIATEREAALDDVARAVLAAVDWTPTATETVLERTALSLGAVAAALTRLELSGLVRRSGGWWERCAVDR
ncbi:MAG TPA: DNA-processing protein DprA [Acidimicrobiales bacterium]